MFFILFLLDDHVKSGSYMDRGTFRITYGYHSRTHLFLKKTKELLVSNENL